MYAYNNSCMLIFAMKYYHCTTIGSRVKTLGGFSPFSPPIYTLGMSWLMELSYTLEYYHAVWDEYIRGQIGGGGGFPLPFQVHCKWKTRRKVAQKWPSVPCGWKWWWKKALQSQLRCKRAFGMVFPFAYSPLIISLIHPLYTAKLGSLQSLDWTGWLTFLHFYVLKADSPA